MSGTIEGNATGSTDATIDASFANAWFGANIPAWLTIGNYGGSGIGLSTTVDALNIFNSGSSLITSVSFGNSTTGKSFTYAMLLAGLGLISLIARRRKIPF